MSKPIGSVLIANRGEIACRVIRTARRMGLRTIAVYSEADRDALHVEMADEAHAIGPAAARDSYLRGDRIIAAALAAGAESIHPGYGFLSENAEFAEACAAAGLVWIGPPASAIRAMGSKSAAKALMEKAGVPLVPGYHGAAQDPALLAAEAGRIGFPVLIKASAGGGGKGMRVVDSADGFAAALELAQGEARAAFGDDRVLVERYLQRPRHIEIQVFADTHGNVVSLFERDCSIQRRHQKVVEEAPAPGMDPARRAAMGRAACDAAAAIGYVGAGTVEFIVEAGAAALSEEAGAAGGAERDEFFFMEMNTRLQVEHPVTELITGQDLVEWQIRVAAGERLPKLQDELGIEGHAIEVRIYAEDPARDYAPSVGRLERLRAPAEGEGVRVDSGVREGDEISVHYDPMIAKLIASGPTRAAAIGRLAAALAAYEVVGVRTNIALLRGIAANAAFGAGAVDTGFLGRHPEVLGERADEQAPVAAVAAVVAAIMRAAETAARAPDPWSPWAAGGGWRLHGAGEWAVQLRSGKAELAVRAIGAADAFRMALDGVWHEVRPAGTDAIVLDGVRRRVPVTGADGAFVAIVEGANWPLRAVDPLRPAAAEGAGEDRLVAPMSGTVVSVGTAPGAAVKRGDVLLVLEAMKTQMRLLAPRDGTVELVRARAGEQVADGAELVRFASG